MVCTVGMVGTNERSDGYDPLVCVDPSVTPLCVFRGSAGDVLQRSSKFTHQLRFSLSLATPNPHCAVVRGCLQHAQGMDGDFFLQIGPLASAYQREAHSRR